MRRFGCHCDVSVLNGMRYMALIAFLVLASLFFLSFFILLLLIGGCGVCSGDYSLLSIGWVWITGLSLVLHLGEEQLRCFSFHEFAIVMIYMPITMRSTLYHGDQTLYHGDQTLIDCILLRISLLSSVAASSCVNHLPSYCEFSWRVRDGVWWRWGSWSCDVIGQVCWDRHISRWMAWDCLHRHYCLLYPVRLYYFPASLRLEFAEVHSFFALEHSPVGVATEFMHFHGISPSANLQVALSVDVLAVVVVDSVDVDGSGSLVLVEREMVVGSLLQFAADGGERVYVRAEWVGRFLEGHIDGFRIEWLGLEIYLLGRCIARIVLLGNLVDEWVSLYLCLHSDVFGFDLLPLVFELVV